MNQYLLSVHMIEGEPPPSPELTQKMFADVAAFNDAVQKAEAWVFGGGLHPVASSTVVRVKGGEVLFSDGPFSEAKEQIGGFWVIKAKDLDEALKWAARATRACTRPVEVRPFQDPAG